MTQEVDSPPIPEGHSDLKGSTNDSSALRFTTPPPQTGDAAPTRTQHHTTPLCMDIGGIVLDDHDVPSVNLYVLQDLKRANKSDVRDWCKIALGKDETSLDAWKLKILQLKWFHDDQIQQALIDFCTVSAETERYGPFARLANRLLYLARGKLPGVRKKNSYTIDDIYFAVHADRPVEPIPEHGIVGAERKPDIVIARRADCDAAQVEGEKLRLRWPQLISFMEFKGTRNLRATLDNKRLDEGLPFVWQWQPTRKRAARGKKKMKKRPTVRKTPRKPPTPMRNTADTENVDDDGTSAEIPTPAGIASGDGVKVNVAFMKSARKTLEIAHAGTKRKREPDDPIVALDTPDSERARDPKNPRLRMSDAAAQVGSYGLELMSGTRGARTSCFSVSMKDDRMWFWHYSPTGILYTDTSISMIDDFEYFAAIMVAFGSCSAETLGALPSSVIQTPDSGGTILLKEDLCGHQLTLKHPKTEEPVTFTFTKHIFTQYGLTGRRTFVYEAEPSPRKELPKVIVKCSYQAAGRRPEYELIEHAQKAGVSHIPDVHMWGDLWTLQDVARENYQLAKRRLHKDDKPLAEPEYEDRVFRAIVYTRYYSIRTLLTKHVELMPLMVNQVLDCLHDLRYKANMLHRDISVNNIMWEVCDDELNMKVIDFDMAIVDDEREDRVPSSKHRVGTLPFIAPDLLLDASKSVADLDRTWVARRHLLRHDIASLFFVCMWIVQVLLAHELTPKEQHHMRERAKFLERGSLEAVGNHKLKLLIGSIDDWDIVLPRSAGSLMNWLIRWGIAFQRATFRQKEYENVSKLTQPLDSEDAVKPVDDETVGGLLAPVQIKKWLAPAAPPQIYTVSDIKQECTPKDSGVDGPSIPLELRKPAKAKVGKKKAAQEADTAQVEDRRARLRPRKNGKAVTSIL